MLRQRLIKIQSLKKCQILCAHKLSFLMLSRICCWMYVGICFTLDANTDTYISNLIKLANIITINLLRNIIICYDTVLEVFIIVTQ